MIEKKISYEINIEKPSKTKPVKQGGVLNYLGKQKTVNAPVRWRSSKDHPIAKLAYITKDEEKILIDLNLYGSLKGKPNKGPFGLPSLQGSGSGSGGDGGSSGGDSGGPGDSGPGGSDDGSGHGGPGPGADSDSGSMGGIGMGDVGGLGVSDTSGMSVGDVAGTSENAGMGGVAGSAVGEAATAAAAEANTGLSGVANALAGFAKEAFENAVNNPVATALGMVNPALGFAYGQATKAAEAASRGVTPPDDYSQAQTSVQSNTPSPTNSGGIGTIQEYAPTYNADTGNPTMDAYMRRLRVNLGLPV
jgi:hypothetical protein